MRRRWKVLAWIGGTLGGVAVASPLWIPLVADAAEPWIRRELLAIAEGLLEPKVELGRLEYTFPLSVDLVDLRLTSKTEAGKEVGILEAPRVGITLDRLPIVSGPLVFRDFRLEQVTARFTTSTSGAVAGWSDLLSGSGGSTDDRPVSDIFAIDRIAVRDLTLEYSLVDNPNKMVLDQLDFEINNKGRKGAKTVDLGRGPGWYGIDTTLTRENLFKIDIDGGLDIDTLVAEIDSLDLEVTIDDESAGHLPPQFQDFVRDRQVEGRVDATLKGVFALDDPRSDRTTFSLDLRPTRFAADEYLIELSKGRLEGRYEDEVLVVDPFDFELFDGTFSGNIRIADEVARGRTADELARSSTDEASPPPPTKDDDPQVAERVAELQSFSADYVPAAALDTAIKVASGLRLFGSFDADRIDISKIHRIDADDPVKVAGLLSGGLEIDTNLGRPLASLGGGGEIEVVDGRFTGGPLVRSLAKLMRIMTLRPSAKDWITAKFTLGDERLTLTKLSALSGPIGARGTGTIAFDRTLDLELNAGPLEGLQSTAGVIGELTGLITDRLAKYVVTGTIGDPRVRVAPLGIRLGK